MNQQQKNEAAYAEVLRDLAHDQPVSGYTRENLKVTDTQLAAVVAHDATIVGESYPDADENIVALVSAYLTSGRNPVMLAGIGAALVDAVRSRAPRWIIADVLNACAEAGEAQRIDARFERETVSA